MTSNSRTQRFFWRPGRLLQNTIHAGSWNVARILLQAGSLILLTRTFGVDTYGLLAGATSLYITASQFVGLGTGIALLRHVVQQGPSNARLRATQFIYFLTGFAALLVAWPVSIVVVGGLTSPLTLACLAMAEVLVAPMLMPYSYLFQAEERLFLSGAMQTLAPIARIVAVTTALLLNARDLDTYALLHLSSITLAVATAVFLAHRRPDGGVDEHSPLVVTVREGLPYVVSSATITASSELDKTILLRVQGSAVTGIYTAAYRIMQAATLPVNSLILAATPRLFRSSQGDNTGLAKSLLIAVLAYSVTAAVGLAVFSPLLHLILGKAFIPSEPILRAFCFNVVTGCVRQLITGRLTASDKQRERNFIEIAGLVTSVTLLTLSTPTFGAWGAIASLAIGDLAVICLGIRHLRIANLPRPESTKNI
jgi:O-antigen/teichoic acid export membrane protein